MKLFFSLLFLAVHGWSGTQTTIFSNDRGSALDLDIEKQVIIDGHTMLMRNYDLGWYNVESFTFNNREVFTSLRRVIFRYISSNTGLINDEVRMRLYTEDKCNNLIQDLAGEQNSLIDNEVFTVDFDRSRSTVDWKDTYESTIDFYCDVRLFIIKSSTVD